MSFRILATAHYRPPGCRTPEELDALLGLAPGTSRETYGVLERRRAGEETALEMGARAAQLALERAGLATDDLDLVVAANATSHQALPYNGAGLVRQLAPGSRLASLDVGASCLSFLPALDLLVPALEAGRYGTVLVVSTEKPSVGVLPRDPEVATLFGDGAAAVLLGACTPDQPGTRLLGSHFATHPEGYELCRIRSGGSHLHPNRHSPEAVAEGCYFEMEGRAVYRSVAAAAPAFYQEGLARCGLTTEDIDWVVPHQPSAAGLRLMARRLGFPPERTLDLFGTHGNQLAASLPTCLDVLLRERHPAPGERILLIGSGAGLSLGMLVLEL